MKLNKKKLSVLVGTALSLGVAGQASADVYAVGALQVSNLNISSQPGLGAVGGFTFNVQANASLNNVGSPGANVTCTGVGLGDTSDCGTGTPIMSGLVQNAPGSAPLRLEDDTTTKFGTTGDYSNAESKIIDAAILLLPGRLSSASGQIAESNLSTSTKGAAGTNVQSNTELSFNFIVGDGGSFQIAFDLALDVLAKVTNGDLGTAQAGTTVLANITRDNQDGTSTEVVTWRPDGVAGVGLGNCGAGYVCGSTEAFSANNTRSTNGAQTGFSNSGRFILDVSGLTNGLYNVNLTTTTSTVVTRRVPVPGTLFLIGAGLLAATGLRRNKSKA